jgi:hypothetical protein
LGLKLDESWLHVVKSNVGCNPALCWEKWFVHLAIPICWLRCDSLALENPTKHTTRHDRLVIHTQEFHSNTRKRIRRTSPRNHLGLMG